MMSNTSKPARINRIGDVGWLIDQLLEDYETGQIKGLMVQYVNKDGTFVTGKTSTLGYIEKLGLLEAAKADITVPIAMELVE